VVEGDSGTRRVEFEVKLSQPSTDTITLAYQTRDGTATAGEDYIAKSGDLVFAPGQTSKIVAINVPGDSMVEPSEFFHLAVSGHSALANTPDGLVGTAQILDDDAAGGAPVISVSSVDAIESIGSGFGGTVRFAVTLSEAASDVVSVNYRTIRESAVQSIDYPGTKDTLTFAPGETVKYVNLRVSSDTIAETDESFALELYDAAGAAFAGDAKVLRESAFILDDDGTGVDRAMSVSSPVLVEGDSGARQAVFEIKLSRPSDTTLNFDYATRDGSAVAGEDYASKSGTISFAPGQTKAAVVVDVTGDSEVELSEFFHLAVEATSALGEKAQGILGTAEILDDDAGGSGPVLSLGAVDAIESIGSGFGGTVRFELTLSEPASDTVTVNYRTLADSALAAIDYPEDSGQVIFAPGETSKFVDIRVSSDNLAETDEAFTLQLVDVAGAVFEGGAKLLRETTFILDDDGTGVDRAMSVSSPVIVEGDGGTQQAEFVVKLSRPSETTLSFDYETRDGSAEAGEDYTATSGTLEFAPGQTEAVVRVDLSGDETVEPTESFDLVVTATTALGDRTDGLAGTATLLDDDAGTGQPVLSMDAVSAVESIGSGFGGMVRYMLTLSEAASDTVTVNYRSLADTADSSLDFPRAEGTLSFAPGETFKTVDIRVASDNADEADEAFVLELTDVFGAVFAGDAKLLREAAFILDDDGVGIDREIHVSSPVLVEGTSGEQEALFEIKLSRPSQDRLTFDFTTKDGSAMAGEDYTATSGTLVFEPGQTEAFVAVPVSGDRGVELSEQFFLAVEPNRSLGDDGAGAVGEALIMDDDAGGRAPTVSIAVADANESIGSGFGGLTEFTVSLSEASTSVVTVDYRTLAGTAEAGGDFATISDTLTFAPGETSKTVTQRVKSDNAIESDEAFVFEVSNATGASLANDAPWLRETVFIHDDDGVNLDRSVFVSDAIAEEKDFGVAKAVFEISLSEAFDEATTLRYTTKNGSARADRDFEKTSGAVTFDAGQTKAFVSVDLLSDFRAEKNETFSLVLKDASLPANLIAVPGSTSGTATIVDNDIRGTRNDDELRGTGDAEGIYGLKGEDKLVGRGGDDQLYGGNQKDLLKAGRGDDVLVGGKGRDKMLGGGGDDLFNGGKGGDLLVGGKGADAFVFNFGDSGAGKKARDTIRDFSRGQDDVIDLSNIDGDRGTDGRQDLVYIGTDADFTGAGQVRFDSSKSLLEINLDADDRAEMRIDLNGLSGFGADDLIL
jgi:urease beta subunit